MLSFIGVAYAAAQGLLAKPVVRRCGKETRRLMMTATLALMVCRVAGMKAENLWEAYFAMGGVGVSLALVNCEITSACARLAAKG